MYPYTGPRLIELLEKQHQQRSQTGLFKTDIFTLQWRTKVGSFPYPDSETIVSAGEPCGAWRTIQGRPEDKRNVGDNWQVLRDLPLYGYVPGASIRGLVRAWATQHPAIKPRMLKLLGSQTEEGIISGKIEFLDAFPETPTRLTLDIVNPQQNFQVFHEGQGTPLSFYTLGDGSKAIPLKVAIRGIPEKATEEEVDEVWQWVQQALATYGVGSRTASGYGAIVAPKAFSPSTTLPKLSKGFATKQLFFTLYSQGNAGPDIRTMELRPSHWRGWLRSWLMRFFLGVMSVDDAKHTVGELLGTLEESSDKKSRKGSVRLQVISGEDWGETSQERGFRQFYKWQGSVKLTAPKEILDGIILPILRVAVMVGGAGRGWRRPLHLFVMNNDKEAARGCHLTMTHKVKPRDSETWETKPFGLVLKPEEWSKLYQNWATEVQKQWLDRFCIQTHAIRAEVFSPTSCAMYIVEGPENDPIDPEELSWAITKPLDTRGQGMELIYQPTYKRKPDVGGNAGNGGSHCSWVSIKRTKVKSNFQEVVCLFLGDQNQLRSQFLQDLHNVLGSTYLFGVQHLN